MYLFTNIRGRENFFRKGNHFDIPAEIKNFDAYINDVDRHVYNLTALKLILEDNVADVIDTETGKIEKGVSVFDNYKSHQVMNLFGNPLEKHHTVLVNCPSIFWNFLDIAEDIVPCKNSREERIEINKQFANGHVTGETKGACIVENGRGQVIGVSTKFLIEPLDKLNLFWLVTNKTWINGSYTDDYEFFSLLDFYDFAITPFLAQIEYYNLDSVLVHSSNSQSKNYMFPTNKQIRNFLLKYQIMKGKG
jgi:hypothetical protein